MNRNRMLPPKGLDLAQQEAEALMREDLVSFIGFAFQRLNPSTPYLHNWHIDLIASKLEACRRGEIRRLIINMPPRNLKSICASIALPAFWLGHDPSAQIICVSYAQELANKLSLDCRTIMESRQYKRLFRTQLSRRRAAVNEFATTQQGFRLATSVGGVITGRGADVIILDDPMKPSEALSDAERKNVLEWYDHTCYSRLNQKETGCIIVIMQRLHTDDLVGHLLGRGHWELLNLAAIAEEDEVHTISTILGPYVQTRRAGEALHPERESLQTLEDVRLNIGSWNFASQYQQTPIPTDGGIVNDAWWQVYEEPPQSFDRVIQSWDTANKATELSDYSVCTTWGIKEHLIYLLDVLRRRMVYPDLKRAVIAEAARWKPQVILIEDQASGIQLIQDLQSERLNVRGVKPDGNKIMRMNTQTAVIERGEVYLPKSAPWLDAYRMELASFPNPKHDDQVDSTSQALAWIQANRRVGHGLRLAGERESYRIRESFMGAFDMPRLSAPYETLLMR